MAGHDPMGVRIRLERGTTLPGAIPGVNSRSGISAGCANCQAFPARETPRADFRIEIRVGHDDGRVFMSAAAVLTRKGLTRRSIAAGCSKDGRVQAGHDDVET